MSDSKVLLRKGTPNQYGTSFWYLSLNTRNDGRGQGGLEFQVDIKATKQGLVIAGELIPWEDLSYAEVLSRQGLVDITGTGKVV